MNLEKYIILQDCSTIEALKQLNALSGEAMTLFVVNEKKQLVGTLTDGDIRRSLISGKSIDSTVAEMMHTNFSAFRGNEISVNDVKAFRKNHISLIPHIDNDGKLLNIFDFSKLHSLLPIDAVLMAGGKGERLRPLTNNTPKPLLKVGEKCIIDYNIEALARNGISNISVTTNYLADQIEDHFVSPVAGATVKCVKEPCRMGTIGSLTLVDGFTHDTILLMNSDLLTNINYEELFLTHTEEDADVTVATIPYKVSVPYGIFQLDDNRVTGLEEKPTYNHYANAGIYLIKRRWLDAIPRETYFDATDFLELLLEKNAKVIQFPIKGIWIDIGSPSDFKQAQDLMHNHKGLSEL